jgi:hypothetical protein
MSMQLKSWLAGLTLAVSVVSAHITDAAVQTVSAAGRNASATLDDILSLGDSGILTGAVTTTSLFQHDFFFEVATTGTGGVTGTPNTLILSGKTVADVTNLQYQVFDRGTITSITGLAHASDLLTFATLAGGNYFVRFTGFASGSGGGNYTANIGITPIPGAIALFVPALAGLGYMRRRQISARA